MPSEDELAGESHEHREHGIGQRQRLQVDAALPEPRQGSLAHVDTLYTSVSFSRSSRSRDVDKA